MKIWTCIGYPDEENAYHQHHMNIEKWECKANTREEAEKKAFEHFYYFHEVAVYEKEED